MNLNTLSIISLILAVIALLVMYRMAQRWNTRKRVFMALVLGVCALPALSFSLYYLHILPFTETAWYYEFRSIAGTELLMVFVGAVAGVVASLFPKCLRSFALLGVIMLSVAPMLKSLAAPINKAVFKDKWKDGVCLQSTSSTCGAASVATILRALGGEVTEADIAADAYSYRGGTEAWYMARAVRARGYEAEFYFTEVVVGEATGLSRDVEFPAVVGVILSGGGGHFITILGKENGEYIVGDPLHGRKVYSHEKLMQAYQFTGFHLLIRKK